MVILEFLIIQKQRSLNIKNGETTMTLIRQFGGNMYDTDKYPYILMNTLTNQVHGRFSTLKKANEGRLMHSLNNPHEIVMLYNEKTKQFIDWQKKDVVTFERYKNDSSAFFDMWSKKNMKAYDRSRKRR